MRFRNRHFNARHAGASLVLDSRFIDQADNSEVSSWADRSTNAHTIQQTTPASRPTFQTNEINGNPVVRFDGSNDFLSGGDILDIGTNSLTMLAVAKRSSGSNGALFGKSEAAGSAGRYSLLRENNSFYPLYSPASGVANAPSIADTSTSARINVGEVERGVAVRLRFNGAQEATSTITVSDTTNHNNGFSFFVGAYQTAGGTNTFSNYFWNGDIAQAVVLFTFNVSLRKRLEHSAAYSFKIACN
jgi:hypothetical protein